MKRFLIAGVALCALCATSFGQTRDKDHDRDAKMRQTTHTTLRTHQHINDHDADDVNLHIRKHHRRYRPHKPGYPTPYPLNHGSAVRAAAHRHAISHWRNHGQMVSSVARRTVVGGNRHPRPGTGGTKSIMPWRNSHHGITTIGGVRVGHPTTHTKGHGG